MMMMTTILMQMINDDHNDDGNMALNDHPLKLFPDLQLLFMCSLVSVFPRVGTTNNYTP